MAVLEAPEVVVAVDLVTTEKLGMSYGALGTVNGTTKFVQSGCRRDSCHRDESLFHKWSFVAVSRTTLDHSLDRYLLS